MPKKNTTTKDANRDEQRNLDIEIGFMEGVVHRDPEYVEALQILGDDYTRRGNFAKGLEIDLQLAKLRPDDALVQYNLGCSYALMSQFDLAIAAIDQALNLGYRDFKWLSKDPDLKDLRKHPAFKKIRAKVKTLQVDTR